MKVKNLLLSLIAVTAVVTTSIPIQTMAQNFPRIDPNQLSKEGKKYYQQAETYTMGALLGSELTVDAAMGGAQTQELKIKEYEKITKTDPDYAPVYYVLGSEYAFLGNEKGEPYFTKAEQNFKKYGNLKHVNVDDHLNLINKMRLEYNASLSICGDWVGKFTFPIPVGDKIVDDHLEMVIRIYKQDGKFCVKVKNYPENNRKGIHYWNNCEITYSDSKCLKWKSYIDTSYDWDNNVMKNGKTIYCAVYTYYCEAKNNYQGLHFTYYMHTEYKDRDGNTIGIHNTPNWDIYLYKKTNNW